jgi:hypothetical protein
VQSSKRRLSPCRVLPPFKLARCTRCPALAQRTLYQVHQICFSSCSL